MNKVNNFSDHNYKSKLDNLYLALQDGPKKSMDFRLDKSSKF